METDLLSATFAALADPTRRAILARLAEGSTTVKELSVPFSMSAPAISKHLRVLERAGLISQGREAQWRPCHLEVGPLKAVADWTESYRRFWEQSFDRLEDYLAELQSGASKSGASQGGKKDSPALQQRRRVTRPIGAAKPTKTKRMPNKK
jgi:DNA-binding transcriptional ArsR family regulator